MRFIVRFGFLLGILGALFWGDVVVFLKLADKDPAASAAAQESIEVVPDPAKPPADAREATRREFERLRAENLADADEEARWRAQQNAAADSAEELERLREEQEAREASSRAPLHPGRGPRPRR